MAAVVLVVVGKELGQIFIVCQRIINLFYLPNFMYILNCVVVVVVMGEYHRDVY